MSILGDLQKVINEHGSSSILRERLSLIKDQLAVLQEERADLMKQINELQAENQQLKKEIEELTAAQEFVECRGALFKRKPSGGFHRTVYCPSCRMPMGSLDNQLPYHCDRCQVMLDFTGKNLESVITELESSDS